MILSSAAIVAVIGLSSSNTIIPSANAFVLLPRQQQQQQQQQPPSRLVRTTTTFLAAPDDTITSVVETNSNNKSNNTKKSDFSDPLRPVVNGETLLIPFSENEVDLGNGETNNGPFSWIAPYMKLGGYEPGAKLVGGIATKINPDADDYEFKDEIYSKEVQEERIAAATEEVVNISPEERQRRRDIAYACYIATAFYAFVSSNILIDDFTPSIADHLWRLAIFVPLSTGYGLQLSADRGL
ncbi:unnamed protein product [Cylindrotheca closterium]|uniref:Uncharacterized protein n=1 Tax=Cylindrotheca closterium TaxID=2856 RepID=A0AAD2G7J7_9STRA|nr:unnamed protein product [Cylindrotheca closterium]